MRDDLFPYPEQTPQVKGRKAEAPMAKSHGARLHPNSGAGRIKDDASNDETVFEFKTAQKSHAVSGEALAALYKRASREGKTAMYVIRFDNGLELSGEVLRP